MMVALRSTETSVLTRATQRNIPEDAILPVEEVFSSYFNFLWLEVKQIHEEWCLLGCYAVWLL
jgi:hypothetical protein